MNKQEDKFFEMYRDSFQGFEPEAPASIYAGIRKKMMWSNFMAFNLSTLNVWYLGLILAGGLGTIGYVSVDTSLGQMTAQHNVLNSFEAPQTATFEQENQEVILENTPKLEVTLPTVASLKSRATQPDASNIDGASNSEMGNENLASSENEADEKCDPKLIEIIEAPMEAMEAVNTEVADPFSITNALQIDMNDLVSQINDPNSGEIKMKLPVTLPATDE
jgi:hypothetical protein